MTDIRKRSRRRVNLTWMTDLQYFPCSAGSLVAGSLVMCLLPAVEVVQQPVVWRPFQVPAIFLLLLRPTLTPLRHCSMCSVPRL